MISSVFFYVFVIILSFQSSLSLLSSLKSSSRLNKIISMSTTIVSQYTEIKVPTLNGIHLSDITPQIRQFIKESGVSEGVITVLSRHTTSAITINELESRLVDDTRQFLLKLVPAAYPYLHNDLHLRKGPPDWPGGDEAWRKQEPVNAHSHLIAMLLGQSEAIPVSGGKIMIGTWQSVILVELDGPRTRSVGLQITGTK